MMPHVSVIVLNWNGMLYVGECLDGILAQSYRDFEVIVVDNGSEDGSLEVLREKYVGRVRLIEAGRNMGYAAGNNLGIEAAEGEWIALFNNDAVPDRLWLARLMDRVDEAARSFKVGMAASKILLYDNRDVIDNTGHLIYPDGLNRGRGRLERDAGQYDRLDEALFPSGCVGLYRREMLDETGLLDEDFFAYGEDADLGLRGRLRGWKCVYAPEARVYHRYSAATSAYSPLKAYHVERNRVWVMAKNFPFSAIVVSPIYSIARYAAQAWGVMTGRGAAGRFAETESRSGLVKVLFRALYDAARGLPAMLKKRRAAWDGATISQREMAGLLRSHRMGLLEVALKD